MTHSGIRGDGTYQTYTFDAANRRKVFYSHQQVTSGRFLYGTYSVNRTNEYDGDGHPLKTTEVTMNIPEWQNELTIVKYQLWSTVLGGYITALKDDGAKETTKVYAGGAVIAEQVTRYGNEVYWIHADPVTGSSTKTTKTGAEYTRKEYEPFGQEVSTFEPEEEFPAPEGNADNLVDANDPHWQCQMADAIGTDFNNRPVHCQRSAQMAGVSNADMYAEIIGHQEAQRKRTQNKLHGMPANATPTNKLDDSEEATGQPLPRASEPFSVGETTGDIVLGLPTGEEDGASVTVTYIDNDEMIDASESGNSNIKGGNRGERKKALDAAKQILSTDSKCSKFFGSNALKALDTFGKQLMKAKTERFESVGNHGIRQEIKRGKTITYFDANGKKMKSYGVNTAYRLFPRVKISSLGPFASLTSTARVGGYRAGRLGSRVAQILHEVAHLIYKDFKDRKDFTNLIEDDGPNGNGNSVTNTSIILDDGEGKGNCKEAIDDYINNLRKK